MNICHNNTNECGYPINFEPRALCKAQKKSDGDGKYLQNCLHHFAHDLGVLCAWIFEI